MNAPLLLETGSSVVVQVALLVVFTAILERSTRSSAWRCRLWTCAFLATITLVAVGFLLPHVRWVRLELSEDMAAAGRILRGQIHFVKVAGVIWLIGFVIITLRRIHRFLTLLHFLGTHCRKIREKELDAVPHRLRSLAPDNTRWLVSAATHGPFCWQLQQPTIVLPPSLFNEDDETLEQVLLHEFEHLRVGHPVQHFLQGVCVSLFWFHPAIHWAAQRAEITREYRCDEVAAKNREGVSGYLRLLAKLAEKNAQAPPCTLAFGRRHSTIVLRSQRLLMLARSGKWSTAAETRPHRDWSIVAFLLGVVCLSQIWLPINVLASDRDAISPWPVWTAETLHDFGFAVRDYEQFDARREPHELLH